MTPRTVTEWRVALTLAEFELDSFDRRWAGRVFRSKDHERRLLLGALEDARLGVLRALAVPAPETQAPVTLPAEPEAEPADNLAPGGLSWSKIEAEYRALAGSTPTLNGKTGRPYRRSHPDRPSRPEVAAALMSSTATLKRACDRHKKGTTWPPFGL